MLPLNSWTWSCGCCLTAGPAVRSPICRHQLCPSVHVTGLIMWPLPASVSAQQPADHHRELLLLVPGPWSRWVLIKPHLALISRLLWIRQLVWVLECFSVCSALICVWGLYFPAFPFTISSNTETFPDWDGWACHTQLFSCMMYDQGSGLLSGHVLFCYNSISTALASVIYSAELLQGQTELYIRAERGPHHCLCSLVNLRTLIIILAPCILILLYTIQMLSFFKLNSPLK